MSAPPLAAAVLVFPGSNGDRDLLETLEAAGFAARLHPSDEPLPEDVQLAGLPGGFSYGDYWRAGVLASKARAVQDLPALVARGGLVIGICNGFQILVEAGLLPGGLTYNTPTGFRHRWVTLEARPSESPWMAGLEPGTRLGMPMAHGEGCYVHPDGPEAIRSRVPLRYTDNPNGSMADAAALTDSSGQVLGIMPHPERAADPDLGSGDGLRLFASARTYLEARAS